MNENFKYYVGLLNKKKNSYNKSRIDLIQKMCDYFIDKDHKELHLKGWIKGE